MQQKQILMFWDNLSDLYSTSNSSLVTKSLPSRNALSSTLLIISAHLLSLSSCRDAILYKDFRVVPFFLIAYWKYKDNGRLRFFALSSFVFLKLRAYFLCHFILFFRNVPCSPSLSFNFCKSKPWGNTAKFWNSVQFFASVL